MITSIVSMKYSPGHVAHLKAYLHLFEEMGDKAVLYLAREYCPHFGKIQEVIYINNYKEILLVRPNRVILYNIDINAPRFAHICKKNGVPFYYVCHEPWMGIRDIRREGKEAPKAFAAALVNMAICHESKCVLLASDNSVASYKARMQWCNCNYKQFPLIFCDEYNAVQNYERKYFSIIGAFVPSHGCAEFLSFVQYAAGHAADIFFMVATKNDIKPYINPALYQLVSAGRLVLHTGRPMSTEEINMYYRQSICVWNAYNRSTQSGVLPNAFMQGTPVIANKIGVARHVFSDGTAGRFIKWPADNSEILRKYREIEQNIESFSDNARKVFLEKYFYKKQIPRARRVFGTGTTEV